MPNRWRDILDSLRKSDSRELKEGLFQLCSYYQWCLVHNQMIQNKRSQLVWDINICCGAYGWCRHMLWSICLVCQVEQAEPRGKTPTNIYLPQKKLCIYHFSWWNAQMKADSVSSNICLGQFVLTACGWMEGKPFMQTICYTAAITQMVLQKTTNTGKFVTSCLVVTWERSSHSGDNASQIVRFCREGLTPCFVGTNFSAACVCHRREENVWRQVIGVMEAKIRSELEGVSGPLTSFFSSLEALVVKSKLHMYTLLWFH